MKFLGGVALTLGSLWAWQTAAHCQAENALEDKGYSRVVVGVEALSWNGCPMKTTTYSAVFQAVSRDGKVRDGVVCGRFNKSPEIRFR